MFDFLKRPRQLDIAVDLGTANTVAWTHEDGVIVLEPSLMALQRKNFSTAARVTRAVGSEAECFNGRPSPDVELIRPRQSGTVGNPSLMGTLLAGLLAKAGHRRASDWRLLLCVPSGSGNNERRAVRDAARVAGAKSIRMIDDGLAAAIKIVPQLEMNRSWMVVDVGASATRVSIYSGSAIWQSVVGSTGGNCFDAVVARYLRDEHGLHISTRMAEAIKCGLPTQAEGLEKSLEVSGHCLSSRLPRKVVVDTSGLMAHLRIVCGEIVRTVRQALAGVSPEISVAIAEQGLLLTGGGALLPSLSTCLEQGTGLVVRCAVNPITCAIEGAGIALSNGALERDVIVPASQLDLPTPAYRLLPVSHRAV